MQSHVLKVHACLAVTCHRHFWQNDRDLLRATAVTRGWNGYQPGEEKSPTATAEDSNPRPFDDESGAVTTELSSLPEGMSRQWTLGPSRQSLRGSGFVSRGPTRGTFLLHSLNPFTAMMSFGNDP